MESSRIDANCICRSKACKSVKDISKSQDVSCIEEYCLDNIDDINDFGSDSFRTARSRARVKKSSKSCDLMTISETSYGYREPKSNKKSPSTKWNSSKRCDHQNVEGTKVNDMTEDHDCCCICHDQDKQKNDSFSETFIYDPGIEEFILDDNELSTSRFFSTPVHLNSDWHSHSRVKSAKKSVKSVSIIDTLSEMVLSDHGEVIPSDMGRSKPKVKSQSTGIMKVRDVKNRNQNKNKCQVLKNKRLSSSLPQLNIPDSENVEVLQHVVKEMSKSKRNSHNNLTSTPQSSKLKEERNVQSSKLSRRLSAFVRANTPDWLSQIFDVAKKGSLKELQNLLDGMDGSLIMNLSDRNGNNLLHICCYYDHISCLKWLITINPESQQALIDENKYGITPVVLAAKRGRLQCIQWLSSFATAQEQLYHDGGGRSVLHHASKHGQLNVVEWITEYIHKNGQNIDVTDHKGCTALHLAAKYGSIKIVKFLVMNGAELNEKDNRGYKAYDYAIFYDQQDCAEFILSVESNLATASQVISMEHDLKNLKAENSEIKAYYKEALSVSKKILKDREQLKQQFSAIQRGFFHLHELLSIFSHDQGCENISSQTSGIKMEELKKLFSNVNSSLQNSHFNSPSFDDYSKKVNGIEEKWRKLRLKNHSRLHNSVTKPIDVMMHQQNQIKLKTAAEKSSIQLLSSSESTLSSNESENSENECSINSNVGSKKRNEANDCRPITPEYKEKKRFSKISDLKCKSSSKESSSSQNQKISNSRGKNIVDLEMNVKSNNRKFNVGEISMAEILGDDENYYPDCNGLLTRVDGQTCSVLEVLAPSSDDDKPFIVENRKFNSVERKSKKFHHKTFEEDKTLSQRSKKNIHSKQKVNYAFNNYQLNFDELIKHSRRDHLKDNAILGSCQKSLRKYSDHSSVMGDVEQKRWRKSPRSMPNRCAKSDVEDLDGPDIDEISSSNLLEHVRFSEPDLIKGTKEVKIAEKVDNTLKFARTSAHSVENIAEVNEPPVSNVEVFPSASSTSDCSVNSISAILDSSSLYQSSTPIKKKGFLLKFQTLKKRWPSRHKFASNKRSQEITPENFKETYMRSSAKKGNQQQMSESLNCSFDERSECDRLMTLPRQRESVCSASSSTSKQDNVCHKQMENPLFSISDNESEHGDESNSLLEMKDSPSGTKLSKRPPLPEVPIISEVPTIIPPPSFPGKRSSHHQVLNLHCELIDSDKKECLSSTNSVINSVNDDQDLLQTLSTKSESSFRPASSASRSEFCPQIVTATAETVKAASAAAGFLLHKSSSISTDLLSPDSSTAGRLSPAPSEISKTESALSPPSDVSKTESTRHLNQLEKIDETKQPNVGVMINNSVEFNCEKLEDGKSLMVEESFEKSKNSDQCQDDKSINLSEAVNRMPMVSTSKKVKIQKSEKPWYDVSDEEDMPSPSRYEMVATAAMCSSSEDETIRME